MAAADTLPPLWRPLMDAPSVRLDRCAVCGRFSPLNQHHMVRRSAGRLFRGGAEVPKPTITLCGFGNHPRDADGKPYCHGLAHANRLHFRWVPEGAGGRLEYLLLEEPARYAAALGMDGWSPLRGWRG